MKNFKYIVLFAFIIFSKSFGQTGFPLKQGSIVMTHTPYHGNCTSSTNSLASNVVAVLNAEDTSGIPSTGSNKFVWTNYTSTNNKNNWFSMPNWTETNLGKIFGVTLDETGNIYVANSSIYKGESIAHHDKIFKIDKLSGAISVVFDYSMISSTNSPNLGIGNLKLFKIGNTNFIAFSCWEDGKIYILREPTGGLSSTLQWNIQDKIKPTKLGANSLAYGIAVRPKPLNSSVYELYYGVYNTSNTGHFTDINSIELSSTGNFIGNENTVLTNISSTTVYCTNTGYTVNNNTPIPISDISFSSDYKKMLVGEQGLNYTYNYQAHNSIVHEYNYVGSSWIDNNMKFSCGNPYNQSGTCPINGKNAVGGVSYWNNVIYQNKKTECDTSILFSVDLIYLSTAYASSSFSVPTNEVNSPNNNFGVGQSQGTVSVYGFQAIQSNNTSFATYQDFFDASLKVDADDIYNYCDKWALGDIEAFNSNCAPQCDCGQWENIAYNENSSWWTGGTPLPPLPTLTFNQGSSTGILFPHYICNGNCNATYTYTLTNSAGNTTNLSGTSSLDLSQQIIKNLPCGSYFINITPKCGNVNCPPVRIPLVIVCPPPCSDCGGNASVTSNGTPTISNGLISGNFTINNSKPVSEIRVLVEEFRVTSNNENCLICKNPPKTWGSIQTATLGALSPALSNAVTIDNREVVFNNNAILPLPSNLAISLALPQSVALSCCEVQVQVCLKFIIRDVNCCEKEILKCFTFTLPQTNNLSGGTGTSTGGTSGTGNPTGGTGGIYANMDSTGKCLPNYKDCDGILANGCEVNVTNDSSNCGACGNVCPPGKTCVGGTCL